VILLVLVHIDALFIVLSTLVIFR